MTFNGIRKDSFLRYREKEVHLRLQKRDTNYKEDYKAKHLLDIKVRNTSFIYDLDAQVDKRNTKKTAK